jgi:hypothetical protein
MAGSIVMSVGKDILFHDDKIVCVIIAAEA